MPNLTPQQYAKKLHALARDELPGVFVRSINRVATAADGAQRRGLRQEFTIRNRWSEGSLMLWRAKPNKNPDKINALVGSKSEYLRLQEEGGVERNRDGSATMSLPSKRSRRGNWSRPVVGSMRLSTVGVVATRGASGAMTPKTAKAFLLKPGQSSSGHSSRQTTVAWRRYRKRIGQGLKSRKPRKRFHEYKLNKDVIFVRQGKKIRRLRVLTRAPVQLRPRHWHQNSIARVARLEVVNAAFVREAEMVLKRLGAT